MIIYQNMRTNIDCMRGHHWKLSSIYHGILYVVGAWLHGLTGYIDFYASLENRGHIVLQLSVGRSVDHVLSAQYLLTPSIDQYQT